jgi:glycosyltransferase involved in cell wall biosynthesis
LSVDRAREEAGAGVNDFLVVFVGRLEHVKGVDILIDAIRSLPDASLKLAIVGGGRDEAEISERASRDPRITFVGYSDRPADWYGAADLVVMPSRAEPFALVALEAMASGAPILASNVDGFAEIFRNRKEALVPPEEPGALAAAIARCRAAKTGTGPARAFYDMSRFNRSSGIAAVTRFYNEIVPPKRLRA